MSKQARYTRGWLCRDKDEAGWVVLLPVSVPCMDSEGMWFQEPNNLLLVLLPCDFKPIYGFLPRKGSCELYDLEL